MQALWVLFVSIQQVPVLLLYSKYIYIITFNILSFDKRIIMKRVILLTSILLLVLNSCKKDELDFENAALVSTFVAPTNVRAIAYNHDEDVFYANNWSTNITIFDASGTSFPT